MPTKPSSGEAVHPLLEDETLREEVLDVMWFAVLRVLGWPKSSRHRREPRRMLRGSPYDADDILIQAFKELLDVDPREVREWKALGVTIAQRRAKDALDKSQARLRETERRPRLHLVSGDQPANPSVPAGRTVLESIAHPDDPEAMVIALEEVRRLFALARSLAAAGCSLIQAASCCACECRSPCGRYRRMSSSASSSNPDALAISGSGNTPLSS